MSCFHPCFIQKFINPYNPDDFTTHFIGSEQAQHIKECQDILSGKYQGSSTTDVVYSNYYAGQFVQFIQIPCGKCIGCRIDYKRSWADRLTYHSIFMDDVINKAKSMFNNKIVHSAYFLTLTYDDDNLNDLYHNEIYDVYSIKFADINKFIKDLRNHFRNKKLPFVSDDGDLIEYGIDYFYSCEYGDSSFRPHSHLILFNVPFDDLEYFRIDDNGEPVYTSDTVQKLWPKGIHTLSKFSWHNAAYTAGYVEKKLNGYRVCDYTALGLEPEACRMSRRPGIAYDYYMKHYKDIWKNGGLKVDRSINNSGMLGIPRYFRKLAEKVGFDDFQSWQKRTNDLSNVLNPIKLETSSFDEARINQLLAFEEREVLSRQIKRKI